MIRVLRLCISGDIPFEHVDVLDESEQAALGIPNFFEDAQVVFKCKDGTFAIPDYKIVAAQWGKRKTRPTSGTKIKRIILDNDLSFSECIHIDKSEYDKYGIPLIFREDEQFVFWCKSEGYLIVPDFAVIYVRMR